MTENSITAELLVAGDGALRIARLAAELFKNCHIGGEGAPEEADMGEFRAKANLLNSAEGLEPIELRDWGRPGDVLLPLAMLNFLEERIFDCTPTEALDAIEEQLLDIDASTQAHQAEEKELKFGTIEEFEKIGMRLYQIAAEVWQSICDLAPPLPADKLAEFQLRADAVTEGDAKWHSLEELQSFTLVVQGSSVLS